jgi:hypothetical protein
MEKCLEATCRDKITIEGGHVSTASSVCQSAMEKKNCKQEGQPVKHMALCGKAA